MDKLMNKMKKLEKKTKYKKMKKKKEEKKNAGLNLSKSRKSVNGAFKMYHGTIYTFFTLG